MVSDAENGFTGIGEAENPWFTALRVIAARGMMTQERRESDVVSEDGTILCGVCGEPRRKYLDLENGTGTTPLLVSCKCRCDRDKDQAREAKEKAREHQEFVDSLYADSLMDGRLRECTFERFQENSGNAKIRKICLRYTDAFDEMESKHQGILMYGPPGTGKTFAAACIANKLLTNGVSVIMTSFVKILASIDQDRDREEEINSRLNRARLLIIDDLGAERSTEYALEKVYGIIDNRYREGKPIILTTNLMPKEMYQTSDIRLSRIYDRVFEVCYPMAFEGESWRVQSARERFKGWGGVFDD